jgi:PII-like signaling protein
MENYTSGARLRIYISSTDQFRQTPLYEFITFQAKKEGLAGATVAKGILGFGASSVIHSYKFWEVSDKVPTVIELIDEEDKVLSFFEKIRPQLEAMKYGCLATIDKTTILLCKAGYKPTTES